MEGADVKAWQEWLNGHLEFWHVPFMIPTDGHYGPLTRSVSKSVAYGMGIDTGTIVEHGVTAALRSKMRNADLSTAELVRAQQRREDWLPRYRERFERKNVSTPTPVILESSWGWHPGVHDGVDLIAPWKNPCLAICTGIIVRADAEGWWGSNPKPSPGHPVSDGAGIVILESSTDAGPFKRGLHFGYGHAKPVDGVKKGTLVRAGEMIGRVGFANAAHIHFMVNDDKPVSGFYRGVGDRDPMPYVDYARRND
jgi:murein DD-endopeptidase MepM/ murein hydrolase activator NlpD